MMLLDHDGLAGIEQIVVIEHVRMELEDGSGLLAGCGDCPVVQHLLLFLHLASGLLKAA